MAGRCYSLPLKGWINHTDANRQVLYNPETGTPLKDPANSYDFADGIVEFPCHLLLTRSPENAEAYTSNVGVDAYQNRSNPRQQNFIGKDIRYETVALQLNRRDIFGRDTIQEFIDFYENTIERVKPFAWSEMISSRIMIGKIVGGEINRFDIDKTGRNWLVTFIVELRTLTDEDLN